MRFSYAESMTDPSFYLPLARAADDEGFELGDGWEDDFTGMLDHAAGSGWVDDDGAVRAHVEWRDA